MSKSKQYRTAEAARLSLLFDACIDTLTDIWSDALATIPEPDRPAALAAGKVAGLSPVLGTYVAGLYAARDGDYLAALRLIREAITMGFDPCQTVNVVGFIYRGIAAELQIPGFSKVLFTPSALALVRWIEVKTRFPCASENGVETAITMVEQRPLAEIREVFTQPFLAEVPVGAGQDAYLDRLLATANDPTKSGEHRAQALVSMAAIALAANDFRAAVKLVAGAVQLAPDDDSAGIGAVFIWLTINALGRDGKLTDARLCPDWLEVVPVLHGALGYDTRHSAESPQGTADPDGGINAALVGRQSL